MKTNELRQKYLDFFVGKDHQLCPSDVLCPKDDPTVLFTPAGMNPFKDHFLGNVKLEFTRATSCQKCVRTGDIENVGKTAFHHTFFEMLGNFSFGDYFKRDAIHWAWEFLTDKKWMGIDPDVLTVTIYKDDDEAAEIWHKGIGLTLDRITREEEDENFWPASAPTKGPNGVCGPCSEIYFNLPDGSNVEIWNLVFTQFNRNGDPPDNLEPLPSKNIDTGMGLERIASVMQGVETNYHIDTIRPIVEAAGEVCGIKYDPKSASGRRLRRITDHVRTCTFAIHENVLPGNTGENSVVKLLLRRATLDGYQLGMREDFLNKIVPAVIEQMKTPYPELTETMDRVIEVIKSDELLGLDTIEKGIARVQPMVDACVASGQKQFSGKQAFELHQTHGVAPELIESLVEKVGIDFDWQGYYDARQIHVDDSGPKDKGVMGDSPLGLIKKEVKQTTPLFYDTTESTSKVVGLLQAPEKFQIEADKTPKVFDVDHFVKVESLSSSAPWSAIIIDSSPFYAESGGQVGDTGTLKSSNGTFEVVDTQKSGDVVVHIGKLQSGSLSHGEDVSASVDSVRRQGIKRAHTATHILHYALQSELGTHAQQQGSKVEDDILRFDFSNPQAVSKEKLRAIELNSHERFESAVPVVAEIVSLDTAKSAGAMMLFGEKYPDPCRMVSVGDFSKELCGGTHLQNTSEIEAFEIISEEGSAAGTRRISALTGEKAKLRRQLTADAVNQVAALLNVAPHQIVDGCGQLASKIREVKKWVSSGTQKKLDDEYFKITSQLPESSQSDYWETRNLLRESAEMLNAPALELPTRIQSMLDELKSLRGQLETLASSESLDADGLIQSSISVGETKLITCEIPGGNPNLMRSLIDQIRKKTESSAVFLAASTGPEKVLLVAGISKDLVDRGLSAGNWVKQIAPVVGGGGGGRPDMAQAGGKQPENVGAALEQAKQFFEESLAAVEKS